MFEPSDSPASRDGDREKTRSWPAIVIVASGISLAATVQCTEFQFSGRPTADLGAILGIAEAALFVWLIFVSRMTPIRRVKVLAFAVAIMALVGLTVYADGFGGDGRPILTWRWAGVTDRKLASPSSADKGPASARRPGRVDLSMTGPDDYPQFRGPDRSGVLDGVDLNRDWDRAPPRLLWRHAIGAGWSSFAVVGRWGVTQEQRGTDEAVVCYDVLTGAAVWEHRDKGLFHEVMGGDGPRATPTIDHGRVFALGAIGTLNCLDGTTGEAVWSRHILEDAGCSNSPFGMAGSPLVLRDLVVVCPGGQRQSLVAYDRNTGAFRWGAGDSRAAYSSPLAVVLAGTEQILIFNAAGLFSHDPRDGAVLWRQPWVTPPELNNVCQPVPLAGTSPSDADQVLVASGFDKGCGLLAVTRIDGSFQVGLRWSNRKLRPKFSSVVVRDGFVYGLDDRILTCVDVRTGERRWKGGRYGYGQLILANDLLLVQAESGEIALVEAAPRQFCELRRFAALDHRTWTSPALAGRHLLVRNDREVACYELSAAK